MLEPIAVIKRFIDGSLSPIEFRDALYTDETFEQILADPELPAGHYCRQAGGLYVFLLALNYENYGDVLDAHGALCDFLDRHEIPFSKSSKYEDFYDLVLNADPGWIQPGNEYVAKILPEARGLEGEELRSWLTQQLLNRFKCADKPPEWIQSPCWPISENGPLVFLGQLDVNHYFHDLATAYVFHDPVSGKCETIIQVF